MKLNCPSLLSKATSVHQLFSKNFFRHFLKKVKQLGSCRCIQTDLLTDSARRWKWLSWYTPFWWAIFMILFLCQIYLFLSIAIITACLEQREHISSKSRRCWWVFYWHLMGGDAFEALTQWYFKFRILSHKDICTVLVCLSRKYSLCIKLNTYHSSSGSLQLNTYQVDIFYPSTSPSLLMLPLVNMISPDFLKMFSSNKTMQFPWPVSSTSAVTLVCL